MDDSSGNTPAVDAEAEIERLKARLQKAEARIDEVERLARIGYWEWDIRTGQVWWSDEIYRMLGCPPGSIEAGYESFMARVCPDDRRAVKGAIGKSLKERVPYNTELRIERPDGTIRIVHGRANVILDESGAPAQMVGTGQDITEYKLLEEALSASELKCRTVLKNLPIGIALIGADRRFGMVNETFIRMMGYSAEELKSMTFLDITHPEDAAESQKWSRLIEDGKADRFSFELRHVRKNGETFWGKISTIINPDPPGRPSLLIAAVEDISGDKAAELKRAEAHRQQRQVLVREVHHRVKNNLQGVAGLLERHLAGHPELGPVIAEAIGRVNALAMIHGLHSESAGQEINLCNVVRGIIRTLEALSPVPVQFKIPFGFVPVEIARDETVPIALVLHELISNSIKHSQAGPGKPNVAITIVRGSDGVTLVIRNGPACLPGGFDLEREKSLGTGLRLVRTLLPERGCYFAVAECAPGVVEATLRLSPPVVNLRAMS